MGEEEPPRSAQSWKDEGNEAYKRKDYRAAIEAYTEVCTCVVCVLEGWRCWLRVCCDGPIHQLTP